MLTPPPHLPLIGASTFTSFGAQTFTHILGLGIIILYVCKYYQFIPYFVSYVIFVCIYIHRISYLYYIISISTKHVFHYTLIYYISIIYHHFPDRCLKNTFFIQHVYYILFVFQKQYTQNITFMFQKSLDTYPIWGLNIYPYSGLQHLPQFGA